MTFYLLVVNEDGEESYSLWKTRASAESERRYLKEKFGYSPDIVEIEAYD